LSHSQPDPTFRTTVSFTRLTAQSALEGLRQQGSPEAVLPAPSTMAVILNRLGFRLRKGVSRIDLGEKQTPEENP
jgi:hypothetical protein